MKQAGALAATHGLADELSLCQHDSPYMALYAVNLASIESLAASILSDGIRASFCLLDEFLRRNIETSCISTSSISCGLRGQQLRASKESVSYTIPHNMMLDNSAGCMWSENCIHFARQLRARPPYPAISCCAADQQSAVPCIYIARPSAAGSNNEYNNGISCQASPSAVFCETDDRATQDRMAPRASLLAQRHTSQRVYPPAADRCTLSMFFEPAI